MTSPRMIPSGRISPLLAALPLVLQRYVGHYNDVIMSAMMSQITSLTIVYSTVYSRRRSKKTSKLRVTGLWAGNSSVTGESPAQRASNAKNLSIWWRHRVFRQHVQSHPLLITRSLSSNIQCVFIIWSISCSAMVTLYTRYNISRYKRFHCIMTSL